MWWPWTSARVDFHKELGPATSSVRHSHQFAIQLSLKHQLFHLASYANRSRVYGSVDISAEHGRMLLFKQEEPCAGCLFILAGTRLWRGRVWVGGSHGKTRGRMISETDVRMRIWANNMGLQREDSSSSSSGGPLDHFTCHSLFMSTVHSSLLSTGLVGFLSTVNCIWCLNDFISKAPF